MPGVGGQAAARQGEACGDELDPATVMPESKTALAKAGGRVESSEARDGRGQDPVRKIPAHPGCAASCVPPPDPPPSYYCRSWQPFLALPIDDPNQELWSSEELLLHGHAASTPTNTRGAR